MSLVILFLVLCPVVASLYQRPVQVRTCEPVTIPLCKQLPYNTTMFPNALEHLSQENALRSGIDLYKELVTMNCSVYAAFFLCSYYLPICALEFPQPIRPCRAVCEKVKSDCKASIRRYRGKWPDHVRCEDLPEYDTDVCVKPESFVSSVSCQCPKPRLNFHLYQANSYRFALKVRIESTSVNVSGGERIITARVHRVLQEGAIRVNKGALIKLYSKTTCGCPLVDQTAGVDLLVAGHEDLTENKLLLIPETGLVETWERAWVDKFKKWEMRLSKLQERRKTRTNTKRRRKDSSNAAKQFKDGAFD